MAKEVYTYTAWWRGRVYLETCPIFFQRGADVGVKASLSQFSKVESQKIRKKQKELFDKQRDQKLKAFIKTFKKRFRNSDAKKEYLRREFADINNIIKGNSDLSPRFYNWNPSIKREDLDEMRSYVNEQIVKGEKNYDFMHSPNYPFQSWDKTPSEVYAQVCWDYFKWLKEFVKALNKKYSKNSDVSEKKPRVERASVPVIALQHFYNKIPINRDNCKEIAAKYGYTSKTSGEGLFQDYCKFSKNAIRVGLNDESYRKNETKKLHLVKVITLLKGNARKNAEEDLATLEKKILDSKR